MKESVKISDLSVTGLALANSKIEIKPTSLNDIAKANPTLQIGFMNQKEAKQRESIYFINQALHTHDFSIREILNVQFPEKDLRDFIERIFYETSDIATHSYTDGENYYLEFMPYEKKQHFKTKEQEIKEIIQAADSYQGPPNEPF